MTTPVSQEEALKMLQASIEQLITLPTDLGREFVGMSAVKRLAAKADLVIQGEPCNDIYFIVNGLTRSLIVDVEGVEHTIHFSLEGQYVTEYSAFLNETTATKGIQTLEPTTVVVMPRAAILWGYEHLPMGDRLGRYIAEGYFKYFDHRLSSQYLLSPAERYAQINAIFPGIQNRVPQHMIASYLGISPVHLSRLKKRSR